MGMVFGNGLSWTTKVLKKTVYREPAQASYDGLGSATVPSGTSTTMKAAFTVFENREIMVFAAADTVNVGDFIRVPIR